MSLYNKKFKAYFTTNNITRGFLVALLSSGAIYLDWFGFVNSLVNTILGVLTFYILLDSNRKVWFWSGFFIGILWFWWLSISFVNYGFAWAIPIGLFITSTTYGVIFLLFAYIAENAHKLARLKSSVPNMPSTSSSESESLDPNQKLLILIVKAIALLILSYIHPFGFDWFKPELVFTNSYIGIEKWQFALVLASIILTLYKRQILYLLVILGAYPYASHFHKTEAVDPTIEVTNFHINVIDKWKPELQQEHINRIFSVIDQAIEDNKSIVILPESIFALFLNRQPLLMEGLKQRSYKIDIVLGALYVDGKVPRNSTYIFTQGNYKVANKVVLVPFGEANPLPKFMSSWINDLFFDGAPDYVADKEPTDYTLHGKTYRNAICYESCSEPLYRGKPKNMIVISNDGWVVPSIEPTQQKILLQYYSKKYGTTIYHSVNMANSYIIHNGKVVK